MCSTCVLQPLALRIAISYYTDSVRPQMNSSRTQKLVHLQTRAAVLTASQCATYDEIKQVIMKVTGMGNHFGTHISASMVTGLVTTTATAPVDVIKTHMFVGAPHAKIALQLRVCRRSRHHLHLQQDIAGYVHSTAYTAAAS